MVENDLTLLYYTSNSLPEFVAQRIRKYIVEVTENKYPIISVSQKPIDFGQNICVGEIGKSKYNLYKQILIGAREVKTKYIACIEDDTLYSPDHFLFRPPDNLFAYEINYWFAFPGRNYYWRVHDKKKLGGMWGNISNTKTLLNNLTKRFEIYLDHPKMLWGEPGIKDRATNFYSAYVQFSSKNPCVIFIHEASLGYKQFRIYHRKWGKPLPEDKTNSLEQFGEIKGLFEKYFVN